MSNWYQALLDLEVGRQDALTSAKRVLACLNSAGIVEPVVDHQTSEENLGLYRPARNFVKAYGGERQRILEEYSNLGVLEITAKRWVNLFGIAALESVRCPICDSEYGVQSYNHLARFQESFSAASQTYLSGTGHPVVICPTCFAQVAAGDWKTVPHLGYCNLAFVFWNWPPFEDWQTNIPDLVSDALGHKTTLTYGRH